MVTMLQSGSMMDSPSKELPDINHPVVHMICMALQLASCCLSSGITTIEGSWSDGLSAFIFSSVEWEQQQNPLCKVIKKIHGVLASVAKWLEHQPV